MYHKQELTPIIRSANLVNMTTTGDEIVHATESSITLQLLQTEHFYGLTIT